MLNVILSVAIPVLFVVVILGMVAWRHEGNPFKGRCKR